MKCHWTASAEVALGVPLFVVAGVLFFSRQKETRLALGILGNVMGILVILLPTELIGVCTSPEMPCHSIMQPMLILAGSLVMAINLAVVIFALIRNNPTPPA